MVTIKAPNETYSGESAGIGFVKGEAQVKSLAPYLKEWFERKGYKVVDDEEEAEEAAKKEAEEAKAKAEAEAKAKEEAEGSGELPEEDDQDNSIDQMTGPQLDAFAVDIEMPEDLYPKSARVDERKKAIKAYLDNPKGE